MAVLDVRSVSKSFGAIRALSDVSFTIAAGEVVGLIGCQFLPHGGSIEARAQTLPFEMSVRESL